MDSFSLHSVPQCLQSYKNLQQENWRRGILRKRVANGIKRKSLVSSKLEQITSDQIS